MSKSKLSQISIQYLQKYLFFSKKPKPKHSCISTFYSTVQYLPPLLYEYVVLVSGQYLKSYQYN